MIDSHCHIDLYKNPSEIVSGIVSRGMFVVSVTTTPLAWRGTHALASKSKSIVTALGMHPQLVASRAADIEQFEHYLPQTNWVGEIGLDGTPDYVDSMPTQIDVFRRILKASRQAGGRIHSIHSRAATRLVMDILRNEADIGVPILHWFSGTQRELNEAIDLGCWFSVGEPMLRSRKGWELTQKMPLSRILTESDGPFVQKQGQPARPWDVESAEKLLSGMWSETHDITRNRLASNLRRLREKFIQTDVQW